MNKHSWKRILQGLISHTLVAVVAASVVLQLYNRNVDPGIKKLEQLQQLIENRFIGESDPQTLCDMAATGMVAGTNDRWSYYISAQELSDYVDHQNNTYVGVGITIAVREDGTGYDILQVEPGSPAQEAGILPGDILVEADQQDVRAMTVDQVSQIVGGEENTQVQCGVVRGEQTLTFTLTRRTIAVQVATGQLLDGNIGYIRIANFNAKCAQETIEQIRLLREQGAVSLIFDVRNNGGGYKDELVELLNYLLPEGDLFCSEDYTGEREVDTSDAACLEMPMAVLMNSRSYSAAEFFAAALEEYGWAVTVGQNTSGKGYFQQTYELVDGSAVALSVGKYFTPKGVSLAETGGLVPNIAVEVDEETDALIYSQLLEPEKDPQIQAAVEALTKPAGQENG